MFNIGGGEILVILLVALIVLGPQRLPEAARQVGKVLGDLRRMSSSFQSELRTAINTTEDEPAAPPASASTEPPSTEPLSSEPTSSAATDSPPATSTPPDDGEAGARAAS